MNKQSLPTIGLIGLLIIAGIAIFKTSDDDSGIQVTDRINAPFVENSTSSTIDYEPPGTPLTTFESSDVIEQNQLLINKVSELESRIVALELLLEQNTETTGQNSAITAHKRAGIGSPPDTRESLVAAGVSEALTIDIMRRRSDIELRRLQLSDKASREGYRGTSRHTEELKELLAESVPLREELGDDTYDRYLYANGKDNRIKVLSVMIGSAAEEANLKQGDLVVKYGDTQMFNWMELKKATSEGELGEYVNVDIMRDGEPMSLWLPRGPLGIRLGSALVEP